MPIQCNVTQDSGAVATYHVLKTCNATFDFIAQAGSASVNIDSYFDESHFTGGEPHLGTSSIDLSAVAFTNGASNPLNQSAIEQYLLTTPTFTGGTQVS